ncbi:MAG: hypothetical protein EAZ53_12765 [Bacteroidetes bacterium]|nr:MAG: hypothetical protein EAZ53_12765 [Bacteroidota bacterium]
MNTLIIHEENEQQWLALKAVMKALKIKFEIAKKENPYNSEFVSKIKESEKQYKNGKFTKVAPNEIDTFLGLK